MLRNFISGQIYHVVNRGVDKRNIFMDEDDYTRAIHNIFEFNDQNPTLNSGYLFSKAKFDISNHIDLRNQYDKNPRKLLVEILAFCLMPNHVHFLLRPRIEKGVTTFMRKFGAGYANYFNQKYQRSGALFQGRYKSVLVNKEQHLLHLPFYIHLNPLDLKEPQWRNREITSSKAAMNHLNSYRWSSYLDYIGVKNFPSLTQRDFLLNLFGGTASFKETMTNWLNTISLEPIKD